MELSLESLGITKEELQQRVVDQIVAQVMSTEYSDEDGEAVFQTSAFAKGLDAAVKERINAQVAKIAEQHVLPKVGEFVESICLQETNKWGEKTGRKMTLTEYMAERADAYLREQVSYDGKSKGEGDSYSWRGTQTRITYLVHQHLHYDVEKAIKEGITNATKVIGDGIRATVALKLAEVSNALKIEVKTGR